MTTRLRGNTDPGEMTEGSERASEAIPHSGYRPQTALAGIPAAARIWLLTAGIATAAAIAYVVFVRHLDAPMTPIDLPWPLLALAVAAAELRAVEVHFRRETHSFSLSEFPAVVGLFFVSPGGYLAAILVGSAIALLVGSRRPVIKVAFNLSNTMLMAMLSMAVVHTFGSLDGLPDLRDWFSAFGATMSATILTAISISTVITLSGGASQFQKLPEMIRFGGMVAFANTSLALLAVSILWLDPALLWLLALPLAIVFLAYRAYGSEREKHERLELLYQSSRILQNSPEMDSALIALLGHARTMFRAELAEVVLYPRAAGEEALRTRSWHDGSSETMVPVPGLLMDPLHERVRTAQSPFFHGPSAEEPSDLSQAMVSPLRGESELIGSLVIANRLTEGTTFSADDLRLLETLAHQAAAALENGHLEQSLAELSRLKEQLRYQAYHDPLTNLPNRSLFLDTVAERLAAPAAGRSAVVLFLDLDDFKIVNDTLGHAAGDRLLAEVADRLRNVLRAEDVAARLGGDEFGVLLDDGPDLARSMSVATRMIDALRISLQIAGQEIQVGASIGIAVARSRMDTADELLRNADVAMYTAKASGKNRVAVFEPTMHAAIVARQALSAELARSLGRGELVVYYQPIVELATGVTTGLEALVRWRHPTRGLIGPNDFIGLAEETGTILALGAWVLEEACVQAVKWTAFGPPGRDLTVTVNLSAQQLAEPTFIDDLQAILARTGLAPDRLVLEMTETVMFHDTSTTIARLETIRALGIRIAIDDFGTGYSSLGHLRRFRVDILKIAQEFVGPADSREDWAFAGAIVALGRTLGLAIIAEGIEDVGQLEHLRELGCESGQGYLFARPLAADAVTRSLQASAEAQTSRMARPTSEIEPLPTPPGSYEPLPSPS